MSFIITLHERRIGISNFGWTTLGLGPATIDEQASSLPILKERFLQKLKRWVKGAKARDLLRLEQLPGMQLERHRVSLEHGRTTLVLGVPLILERRYTGAASADSATRATPGDAASDHVLIGFHPLVQRDFFVVDPDKPVAQQYARFLEHLMRDEEDEDVLRDLEVRKDRLRTLVFDAEIPSLLERVGPARGAWWKDLEPTRKKGDDDDDDKPASELDTIATDLSERASEKGFALGLERDALSTRLRTLAARGSVVLVGPSGVGKSTLIHRWVHERLHEDGYAIHKSLDQVRRAWSVAGRRILAGMKHHGDWEARMARLLDELARRRGFLVVPDIVQWSRLGRSRDSERNLADVMRGPLERREVTVVAEATAEGWSRLEEDAPAFAAQFQVLTVPEPHGDELVRMLLAEARLKEDGDVVFETAVFDAVREWSQVLYPGRAEPGRSLSLLADASQQDEYVTVHELIDALTDRAGVPPDLLRHASTIRGYRPEAMSAIGRHIVGQAEATQAMVDLLQRVRTGLTDPSRPWGVFLLTGPTGTGKTELAKGLAAALYGSDERLLRIDMNQLSGPDAAARLIGDSFAPDGRLTAPILDTPFQVVLLDELEKAHPSVLYLLLQLLDEGRLTDAAGRTADFRRAVILVTSNLGAAAGRPPLGFGDPPDAATRRGDTTRAVAAALPPELFNRLDGVLAFQPLGRDVALTIAERQVARLAERAGIRDRHGNLTCSPAALDLVVRQGFDPEYGARTVKRWIESHITDAIAAGLVAIPGDGFKRVIVDVDGADRDTISVRIDALATPAQTHALPWAWLLDFAPADCDKPLDTMIARLAALLPRGATDDHAADDRPSVVVVDADGGDRLYWREELRAALAACLKTMRRIRSQRRTPVREIVAELSRASFLARVADHVDPPVDQPAAPMIHRATIRLSRPMRGGSKRLFKALAATYTDKPWEVEASAWLHHDGRVSKDAGDDFERAVLRVSGLGVREALAAEVGSHVLDTISWGLEVVTMELLDDTLDARAPADIVTLEPAALGQQVRTLRHEAVQNDARPYVVLDHRTGHRESGHMVELQQLTAWCLALARSAEPRAEVPLDPGVDA